MCRMKSFFLTWEESESHQAAELGDTKSSIWTKVWTRAGAYLSIGVGNLAELLNMLLGQLDAVGVAHQDVLFDRDRSIPRCVRFLKQLTQCWKIYESPTLPWRVSLQSMHVTTWSLKWQKIWKSFISCSVKSKRVCRPHFWEFLIHGALVWCTSVVHWCGTLVLVHPPVFFHGFPSPTELALTRLHPHSLFLPRPKTMRNE